METRPVIRETDLKGLKLMNRGKVRDIYDLGHDASYAPASPGSYRPDRPTLPEGHGLVDCLAHVNLTEKENNHVWSTPSFRQKL